MAFLVKTKLLDSPVKSAVLRNGHLLTSSRTFLRYNDSVLKIHTLHLTLSQLIRCQSS
jgi:hypothetical protein